MDTELVKFYPGFGTLLSRLKEKLSDDGASPNAQKAFDQSERDLAKARSHYLTNKLVYAELQDILTDLELLGQDHGLNSEEEKAKDLLCANLTYAELHDYLQFCPATSSSSTLFGIAEDDLNRHNPVKMSLSGLVPRLEERLLHKCEDLYSYFDPSNSAVPLSDTSTTPKALRLPGLVQERQTTLARERKHLQHTRQQRDSQFWAYFYKLLECLSAMESLIETVKCGSQAETDKTSVEHLTTLCKLTCLKVRSATLHVLCDTYTVDSTKALSAVSGHLDTAINQAKRQLSATNQSLHAFRRLGPEFTALAQQMAQLQKELENKRWGLEQFGEKSAASIRRDTTRPDSATSGKHSTTRSDSATSGKHSTTRSDSATSGKHSTTRSDPATSGKHSTTRSDLADSTLARALDRVVEDTGLNEDVSVSKSTSLSLHTGKSASQTDTSASANFATDLESFLAEATAVESCEDALSSEGKDLPSISQTRSHHGKKVSFQ